MKHFFYPTLILIILLLLSGNPTIAQVGIGNINPAESSLLDVRDNSNNKGILIPRVNITNLATQAPITSATIEESLLVYNINTTTGKGFYYWDASGAGTWVKLLAELDNKENIYTTDGTLLDNREIIQRDKFLQLLGSNVGRNALTLKRDDNTETTGLSFKNSGDSYDSAIFMGNPLNGELIFATVGNDTDVNNLGNTLLMDDLGQINLPQYGGTNFLGIPQNLLAVNTTGDLVELPANDAYKFANQDWFEEGTTNIPNDIDDTIWTNGDVGIGTNTPTASLHISEPGAGTPASATDGTILIEHDGAGGQSSIVFKSRTNINSDFGYINFNDNGSANGSTNENSLLTIGVGDDATGQFQDDINIAPSGELMISLGDPNTADYNFSEDAFSPLSNEEKDLGTNTNRWENFFTQNIIATNTLSNNMFANNINVTDNLQLNAYGIGAKGGTPTYTLGVDAAGNVIELDAQIGQSVKYQNTNTTQNLNLTNNEIDIYENLVWNDNPALYSLTSTDDLRVSSAGRYKITVNLSFTSPTNNVRNNIDVQLKVNNTFVGSIAANGYLRNTGNHNNSSVNFTEVLQLNANDIISINAVREADAGTINLRSSGSSTIYIEKIK